MSNALREAMAVGTACVATDVFGVEESFQQGKAGIAVSRGAMLRFLRQLKAFSPIRN